MQKVFRKIGTEETLPYNTTSVLVEKTVVVKVKQPIYDKAGNRLSVADLKNICGLEVLVTPDQTEDYIMYHKFVPLFAANPDLEPRVLEYKAFFDELGISYDSNTDAMEAAINEKIGEANRVEYVQRMQTALTNVKVNLQAAITVIQSQSENPDDYIDIVGNDFETWLYTPYLFKFMPSAKPVEPEYLPPYVEE